MTGLRFTRPPGGLTRRGVTLDNVVLAPASLLPFKSHWQRLASDLAHREIVIVLPYQAKQQRVARSVATQLRAKGKHVRLWSHEPRTNTL